MRRQAAPLPPPAAVWGGTPCGGTGQGLLAWKGDWEEQGHLQQHIKHQQTNIYHLQIKHQQTNIYHLLIKHQQTNIYHLLIKHQQTNIYHLLIKHQQTNIYHLLMKHQQTNIYHQSINVHSSYKQNIVANKR